MQMLDFAKLDSNGTEYYSWVTDVENHLTANEILPTIRAPNADLLFQPTTAKSAQALILMRRHMDESLRCQYMSIKDPRALWIALEERFGNIQDILLPDLKMKWNDLRFADFKTVSEYNLEALRIKSMLGFCGVYLTEQDLIEKTLSTFPVSAIPVSKQYRLEYNAQRIMKFHQLITAISVAMSVGTKSVHETNYGGAPKGGRKERNPKVKGHQTGCVGPYNRPTKEGNLQNDVRARDNVGQRGRGRAGAVGRGGAATNVPRGRSRAKSAPQSKGGNHSDVCYRCGSTEHWFKQCNAMRVKS